MDAVIFVLSSPIWLGVNVATLVIERMYAYSGDTNDKEQFLYYGKRRAASSPAAGACSMDNLYALQHIGYMISPQADCGWIGDSGHATPAPLTGPQSSNHGSRSANTRLPPRLRNPTVRITAQTSVAGMRKIEVQCDFN